MTARQATILFCRTSATMADVARAYGTDEDTMRGIIAAQCAEKPIDPAHAKFNRQVVRARRAYDQYGFTSAFRASEKEKRLARRLHMREGLSLGAIAQAFGREKTTIYKWILIGGD